MFPEIITTMYYISVSIATVSTPETDRLSSFDVELQPSRVLFLKFSTFLLNGLKNSSANRYDDF